MPWRILLAFCLLVQALPALAGETVHQARPGDLLFFATGGGSQVSHAGIYVGEGRFVHAPQTGGTPASWSARSWTAR